jgi:hypothetical protein
MTTIVAPPSNASKWQMGFNSAFKGLKQLLHVSVQSPSSGSVLFELAKVIVIKIIKIVLLEKLTGCQPVKKFSVFYGTRKFITSFTSACHMSLS